ncbi:ribosome production factor 2 homolog [Octopus bimaculoides]|uniref:Ribosome production factor 2 homolog n=1 Tax=Octopus bimaculoides TaxID=37653 RepID=A0A0L8GDK6_OCTBM|nr:ribosome production factor 2 homolog [Octopus bimaculoides]|eukprot:XP_014782033.1 PREDICTED: ribosome production factor 2 homolog [Octopus bimaculoides]
MVLPLIVPTKTQKGKRTLERREPKIFENTKVAMIIKGGNTSETVTKALRDIYVLKKPNAVMYKRKNIIRPFESENSLDFFSARSDASLFMFGSHSKKKPANLVIGRFFDHHVMDMIELGIEEFKSMMDEKSSKVSLGTKPCLLFAGDPFEQDADYVRLKNLFIDFFRGAVVDNVRLAGLEHVIMFVAADGKIYMRNYKITLKKSGCRTPYIELSDMGPSFEFVLRRTKLATDALFKRACKHPRAAKVQKRKNIAHDAFRNKTGRIHMERQDYSKLQTRKVKAYKARKIVEKKKKRVSTEN